ncbi:MAG: serine hydroxymethyltransferase [Deltaproteobacteria bacterium]|jgi:glycine hydroxymethyltransferase|nr:serine hydroxymethyltransferase [Deltaproteobacteria bacterium]
MSYLSKDDPELKNLISDEANRLDSTLNLIAAENHSPFSILEIMGSVLNTKTIEGYPGKRFHAGCTNVDCIESLAIDRGKSLFGAEYINVQPHSGTSANLAVYFSVLNIGDRILAMSLPSGGHLSHGHLASITSKCFDFTHYKLDPKTELIDYEQIRNFAHSVKPKMIVAGASSYPRLIDYKKISKIAKEVSALFLTDMAHLAGLVAAKLIPSPVPYCDFVTFTCYKTMMGGRGGIILSKKKYGKKIDSAVFPGCQGTSAVNLLAAKALIFKLAAEEKFISVQKMTLKNAKAMAQAFMKKGYHIVSKGTDNHQVLIDLSSKNISGKAAENCLEKVGIILNRNVVPNDADNPGKISGIRIGTGAVSARGMGELQMRQIVDLMDTTLSNRGEKRILSEIKEEVLKLCQSFPIKKSI